MWVRAQTIAKNLGEFALEYGLGLAPPLLGILISIITVDSTWKIPPPLFPLETLVSRAIGTGHYLELDSIFIPVGALYIISSLIIVIDGRRKKKKLRLGALLFLIVIPAIVLLVAVIYSCESYAWFFAYQNDPRIQINKDTAAKAINAMFICVCVVELYFAIHRFDTNQAHQAA